LSKKNNISIWRGKQRSEGESDEAMQDIEGEDIIDINSK
jgi:hypothetical protein